MVAYALDASALLPYLDNEAEAGRVEEIIRGHLEKSAKLRSWQSTGGQSLDLFTEIMGILCWPVMSRLAGFDFDIVPVTAERTVRAAILKANRKIEHVDAFGVEWASTSPDHVFVTADLI